jgi:hypothetical protein
MSNEKQQTAVEWFMEKIGEKQPNGLYVIDTLHDVQNVFQQAKEMEKEQIMKAHISAGARLEDISIEYAEQYYEQTYNGGNK